MTPSDYFQTWGLTESEMAEVRYLLRLAMRRVEHVKVTRSW